MAQEKTIEQLLKLSTNQYYGLTQAEQKRLNDFLSQQEEKDSTSSPKKNSKKSDKKTPVRVKNIVDKADTSPETYRNASSKS